MEKCKIMEINKVGLTYKIKTLPIFILTKRNSGRYLRQMQPPYQSFNRLVLGIANFLNFSSQNPSLDAQK